MERLRTDAVAAVKLDQGLEGKLGELSEDAADIIREVCSGFSRQDVSNLRWMWECGKRIADLSDPAMSVGRNRDTVVRPLAVLAELINRSTSYLAKMQQFYNAFPAEKDRDELLNLRRSGSGKPLRWGHFEQLLTVWAEGEDNQLFKQMLRKVVQEDMEPEQLKVAMQSLRRISGQRPAAPGGRPITIPPTFSKRATRFLDQTGPLLRSCEEIFNNKQYSLLAAVMEMPQDKVAEEAEFLADTTSRIEQNLRQLQANIQTQLSDVLPAVHKHLDLCRKRVAADKGVLEAKALAGKYLPSYLGDDEDEDSEAD